MEEHVIDSMVKLTDLLRTGGPWALLAITFGVLAWVYKKKEEQSKWFYEQLIALAHEQTAATLKTEGAIAAFRELLTVVFSQRGGTPR